MRQQYIQVKTRKTAAKRAPWAAKIVKTCGGYLAFESVEDYRIWRNQR